MAVGLPSFMLCILRALLLLIVFTHVCSALCAEIGFATIEDFAGVYHPLTMRVAYGGVGSLLQHARARSRDARVPAANVKLVFKRFYPRTEMDDILPRVACFEAMRDIQAGEELFFDYGSFDIYTLECMSTGLLTPLILHHYFFLDFLTHACLSFCVPGRSTNLWCPRYTRTA